MDARLPSPLRSAPAVLLRVECHDKNSLAYNGTFKDFDMVARDPKRPITRQGFDDCLSWAFVKTPFIPFTNSWRRALQRRRKLIEKGEKDVVIIAIWSKELLNVYDAYDVAKMLGYPGKRLEYHLDEFLVYGGISADDYRVLAIFDGQKEQEDIALHMSGLQGSITVPDSFMTDIPGRTAKEKLENEIYRNTDIRGDSEQMRYLAEVLAGASRLPWLLDAGHFVTALR
ncbi:MAG: hypothetical protein LQ342_002014 [Letrouitia transgressa]|nr:MAG: hypothetical protein LQ342_002014 [Letrouitia transgressa]